MPPNPYVLSGPCVGTGAGFLGRSLGCFQHPGEGFSSTEYTVTEVPAARSKTGEKKCSHTALCLVQIGLSIVLPWLNEFLDVEI